MDEYIEEIINEKVEKLDIDEFKEWLQQNKIDEKDNFVNLLVKFVKSELEKDNGDGVNVSVDDQDDIEIKELIGELIECLSNEEKNEKNYFMSYEENAIKLLIDYFISKWNKKIENLKFMYLVSNLLPYLIEKSYKVQIDELIPKLDYVEIPEIKFKSHKLVLNDSTRKLSLNISTHNKFLSTRKNLCGYEFPTTSKGFKFSKTSRFEKDSQHYAIMCYIPLIGLCTYPERHNNFSNIFLIGLDLSPFTKIALGIKTSELVEPPYAIFSSSFFHAIIKYKWHTFARRRFVGVFLLYFINSVLFTVMVTSNAMTINNNTTETIKVSAINVNRKLIILSIITGMLFQTLISFRTIILLVRFKRADLVIMLTNVIVVLTVITGILEYKLLNLFLDFDVQEQFFIDDYVSRYLNILPYFRFVTTFMVWLGALLFLGIFKSFGRFMLVIMCICRKAFRILALLFLIVFFATYASMLFFIGVKSDDGKSTFEGLDKLLQYFWLASIGSNYDFIKPWDKNNFVRFCMFVFSIFTTIMVVNLLIAFVNDIYVETSKNLDTIWNLNRVKLITFIELICLLPSERNNKNYFPLTIIYEANANEVEKHNQEHESGTSKE